MKIYNTLQFFLFFSCLISCSNQNDAIKTDSGVFSAIDISVDDVKIPEKNQFGESPTLNGAGYVFFHITPIGKLFLNEECLPGKRVVDIGCGFSDIPIKALEREISEYTASDISEDHLKILVKKAGDIFGKDKLSKLKLLHGKAPNIMLRLHGKYDAIFADKVIHFFSPNEIEYFIELAKSFLVTKGRIYITATSIYSKFGNNASYKKQYAQRIKEGKKFPGYFHDVMSKLEKSEKVIYSNKGPDEMILFSKPDLENLFKRHGMKVTFSCSLKMPEKDNLEWKIFEGESYDNPSDFVGIIAEKTD